MEFLQKAHQQATSPLASLLLAKALMCFSVVCRVANYVASTVLDPPASDLTGSFRLYKREVTADHTQIVG